MYVLGQFVEVAFHTPDEPLVVQRLADPHRGVDYVLVSNGRMFEPTWYIHFVEQEAGIPDDALVQNLPDDPLFWTYSEKGYDCLDPEIELVAEKYIVFWRGGLRHALYDIDSDEELVNEYDYGVPQSLRGSPEQITEWKRANVDATILAIIDGSAKPDLIGGAFDQS